MKASILIAWAILGSAVPSLADFDGPAQATLNATVQAPVLVDGRNSGTITILAGRIVNVDDVQATQVLIDFAGAKTWIPRMETDFDQRLADYTEASAKFAAQAKEAFQQRAEIAEQQRQQASADFQSKLDGYVSPLESAPYDNNRSVVDYYDCWGNRYNIGVFGQRIYN